MRNLGNIHIRLALEGTLADQFEKLKEKRALRNNTELIRQLIREAYLRMPIENIESVLQEVAPIE